MSGRVRGNPQSGRIARFLGVFAALTAGGMVFGGFALLLGAPLLVVLAVVLLVAAFIAGAVTS